MLERHAPWGFVACGLTMIAFAAFAGQSDALGVAFATLGTGLLVIGGLAARLEGPIEFAGVKAVLGVRHEIREAQRAAEAENRPDEAERLGALVDAADDWFQAYLCEPRHANPYIQAAQLKRAWDNRATSNRS